MKQVVRIILAAATVAALAVPAFAADKLIVKDAAGSNTVFKVDDLGKLSTIATVALSAYLVENTNNATIRSGLRADGVQYWQLNSGTAEAGQLMYSTPAGFPGIVLYTQGWANRLNWANFGTRTSLYFQTNVNNTTFNVTSDDKVGIGQLVPTQKLEVNGGIRLNPTSVSQTVPVVFTSAAPTQPLCDVNARGTLWYLNNGAAKDNLQVCVYTGSAYAWTNIY
jgi:hypothetical protein